MDQSRHEPTIQFSSAQLTSRSKIATLAFQGLPLTIGNEKTSVPYIIQAPAKTYDKSSAEVPNSDEDNYAPSDSRAMHIKR